ncbi:hypothetical protein ABZS66_50065 [Dactylosporangium sp. NPDC005572]|uniref:hypothetical protein n=1 Tax=Dactylosporangium sp. NPDC005572 TaxID=3156889 RepID=UPI0033AB58E9
MTVPVPRQAEERLVWLDYGQFSLSGNLSLEADYMALLERAVAGSGIAGDEHGLVVISPHQNNFEMPFRVEQWNERPPDDAEEWEEVLEGSLLVVDGVLHYFSPTDAHVTFQVPSGRYAVRISGRGFVNRGWPGSTTPGDRWRVQLWPGADGVPERRVKRWGPPGIAE